MTKKMDDAVRIHLNGHVLSIIPFCMSEIHYQIYIHFYYFLLNIAQLYIIRNPWKCILY